MMNSELLDLMTNLGFKDGLDKYRELASKPGTLDSMTFEDALCLMLNAEFNGRSIRRQKLLLNSSRLPSVHSLGPVEFDESRGADFRKLMLRLQTLDFVAMGQNVNIFGGTGTGKSFILQLLGRDCCLAGHQIQYYVTSDLLTLLASLRGTTMYKTKRRYFQRLSLLILDDFCLTPYTEEQREVLFDVLNDRFGRKSTMVASQQSPGAWKQTLGGGTLADSIVDRIANNNYTLLLEGGSRRRSLEDPPMNG